ncbi:hypothetical protein FUAX_20230 [Fulvitalea axinellae]|uniref:DUF452 family protein n=1 Tax=Fulvitalea axinellae TaxID=1182444 RepID=A0AAU9CBN2_9BACT|nr:hypothetical protein FUAX_20230 [Fulvitalea axinellae]
MKTFWLHNNNNDKIILFFAGWGQDPEPFLPLPSDSYDVLMAYDYAEGNPKIDLREIVTGYREAYLVGWSMGVWFAQEAVIGNEDLFDGKFAVNGTLNPLDDEFGIPPKIFQGTYLAFSEVTRKKFFQRMCYKSAGASLFFDHSPKRDLDSQKAELKFMLDVSKEDPQKRNIFSKAIIGENDLIFPSQNQKNYWEGKVETISMDQPHFPFYAWPSWDEFLRVFS